MDTVIIIAAVSTFIIFFILHLAIFRFLGSGRILNGLVYSLVLSVIFHILWLVLKMNFAVFAVSLFISILMITVYIWLILGPPTTSLTIQLLTEINKKADKGITYGDILRKYNREIIIGNRLRRLTDSGEIRQKNGKYIRINKLSYFSVHLFLIKLLNRLYRKNRYGI